MEDYLTIKFGEYADTPVNEIPMEYLTWLFNKLYFRPSQRALYKSILRYFLTRDIKVKRNSFYFNDYKYIDVQGNEICFLKAKVLKNSKGENVYAAGNLKYPIFIEEKDGKFGIVENGKYDAINYLHSGNKLFLEKTPDYWFYDNKGLVMINSFLMEAPIVPEELNVEFSNNIPNDKH